MLEQLTFQRLLSNSTLLPFDCNDSDLTNFFNDDALPRLNELLAVTYTFEMEDKTIAFFSVLNDKIINEDMLGNRLSNAINRLIPNKKRRPTYPAVKVGRLGVHFEHQRRGIGSELLAFIKSFFTIKNKTGCRFITVDAYNNTKVIEFYEKNGFKFLTIHDEKDDTRLMYFDLKTFVRD